MKLAYETVNAAPDENLMVTRFDAMIEGIEKMRALRPRTARVSLDFAWGWKTSSYEIRLPTNELELAKTFERWRLDGYPLARIRIE